MEPLLAITPNEVLTDENATFITLACEYTTECPTHSVIGIYSAISGVKRPTLKGLTNLL